MVWESDVFFFFPGGASSFSPFRIIRLLDDEEIAKRRRTIAYAEDVSDDVDAAGRMR